jgi:hypothetical protein
MNNRLENLPPTQNFGIDPESRKPPSREDFETYPPLVKQWALQHPVPCLAAAFALGALVAWFVKRR